MHESLNQVTKQSHRCKRSQEKLVSNLLIILTNEANIFFFFLQERETLIRIISSFRGNTRISRIMLDYRTKETTVKRGQVTRRSVPNRNLNTCDFTDASSLGFLVYSYCAIALTEPNAVHITRFHGWKSSVFAESSRRFDNTFDQRTERLSIY